MMTSLKPWILFWYGISFFFFLSNSLMANSTEQSLKDKVQKIHLNMPVIDGHNDLPWQLKTKNIPENLINLKPLPEGLHTDINSLKEAGVGLQFWSAYVPAELDDHGGALKSTLQQIDLIHRLIDSFPDQLELAQNSSDVTEIRRKGKIASMIGVEGGYSIEGSLAVLRTFYQLGVRYLTLTHSKTIFWADSATDIAKHEGLTDFGRDVIKEMNRLGMIVDISHVSVPTMKDVLNISKAPIIASHSSAFGLIAHPRNIPDDVLGLIKKNRGVVMVNFYSGYVVPEAAKHLAKTDTEKLKIRAKFPKIEDYQREMKKWWEQNPMPEGSITHVIDHIDYIAKKIGVDYVGLGSDFDGVPTLPKGIQHVRDFPNITMELLKRGYKESDIRKILGDNALRVLGEVERVANETQKLKAS